MVLMPMLALALMIMEHGPMSLLGGIASGMLALGLYVSAMSLRFVFKPLVSEVGARGVVFGGRVRIT